jgi:hypothetical protein
LHKNAPVTTFITGLSRSEKSSYHSSFWPEGGAGDPDEGHAGRPENRNSYSNASGNLEAARRSACRACNHPRRVCRFKRGKSLNPISDESGNIEIEGEALKRGRQVAAPGLCGKQPQLSLASGHCFRVTEPSLGSTRRAGVPPTALCFHPDCRHTEAEGNDRRNGE